MHENEKYLSDYLQGFRCGAASLPIPDIGYNEAFGKGWKDGKDAFRRIDAKMRKKLGLPPARILTLGG